MSKTVSAIMMALLALSTLALAFNIQRASASDTIIDTHGDSRFTKYPIGGAYWWSRSDSGAYAGNFWYTYCGDAAHGGDMYWGKWDPPYGQYAVFVWIPNPTAFPSYVPTHSAKYQIWHSGGFTEIAVNQALRLGGWYSLGSYTFVSGSMINLDDRTGEPYVSTMVAFDAIKFTPIVPPRTLTVSSAHDSPSPSNGPHTYNNGDPVTCSVSSPVFEGNTRWDCTGWTGTGSVPSSGTSTSTGSFIIAQDSSITWNWQGSVVQRTLTVSSAHDSPSPSNGPHTYNDGSSVTCVVSSPVTEAGTIWDCTGWTGTGSVPSSGSSASVTFTMTQTSSITWNWQARTVSRTLTVFSAHDSPVPSNGAHSYINGQSVTCSVSSPVTEGSTIWTCTGWTGTGSVPSSGSSASVTFTITQDSTITWNWGASYPDFVIFAIPISLTVGQGDTCTSTINVYSFDGFNDAVSLARSGMPSGVAAEFDVSVVIPPPDGTATSTLTIVADWTAQPQSFVLTVTGTSGTLVRTVEISLAVTARPFFTFSPENPKSGDTVTFTATGSYDWYLWNFNDGTTVETHESTLTHRFRGAMVNSITYEATIKQYSVGLTMEDKDQNPIFTGQIPVPVEPLTKQMAINPGSWGVDCGIKATYNWVRTDQTTGHDIYMISRFDSWSHWLSGAYAFGVLHRVNPSDQFRSLIWSKVLISTPGYRVHPYTEFSLVTYSPAGDGIFMGIEVTATEVMGLYALGNFPILMTNELVITQFNPTSPAEHIWKPKELEGTEWIDLLNKVYTLTGWLLSPSELSVYDSQGRVTGFVNGQIREEIPDSAVINGTVIILNPTDSYRYDVTGIDIGEYGLRLILTNATGDSAFAATNIPISSDATHEYSVDWNALSIGGEGVTVEVDSDGNGVPEYAFTSDSELSRFEYVAATTGRDLGITGIDSSKSVVGQGYTLPINVTVVNYGAYPETFDFAIYANDTPLATQIVTLDNATSITVTYDWDTTDFAKGNYVITAVVDTLPGETYTVDNILTSGTVLVTIPGDITGPNGSPDGKVDMRDIGLVAFYFGLTVPPANANCDLTGPTSAVPDGKIDMRDIGLVAKHFGEHYP